MILYLNIHLRKALILSLLFQGLLLSIDYFTLWLNVSLFNSIAEINESHNVGGYHGNSSGKDTSFHGSFDD